MPEPTPEAWAQIRHAYEHTDKPIVDICFEHDITAPMLRYRVKCWDWTRRKPFVPRHGPPAVTPSVIPGRGPQAASPESITPAAAYGFRGHALSGSETHVDALMGVSRNDEVEATAPPPVAGEEPVAIVPRLQSAVARLLPAIETNVARLANGDLPLRDVERAGRALSALTRALRELKALLAQHDAPLAPEDDPVPKDMDEFRYELARRIRGFIAARKNEQGAQPDQGDAAAMDGPAKA